MNKNCRHCFFFDQCSSGEVCEDYTPLTYDVSIEETIESGRTEFHEEWFRYIEENNN